MKSIFSVVRTEFRVTVGGTRHDLIVSNFATYEDAMNIAGVVGGTVKETRVYESVKEWVREAEERIKEFEVAKKGDYNEEVKDG